MTKTRSNWDDVQHSERKWYCSGCWESFDTREEREEHKLTCALAFPPGNDQEKEEVIMPETVKLTCLLCKKEGEFPATDLVNGKLVAIWWREDVNELCRTCRETQQPLNVFLREKYVVMGTGWGQFGDRQVFELLKTWIIEKNHPNLILMSGMSIGWDSAVAKAAIATQTPWVAVVPNKGYGNYYWGRAGRLEEFNDLLRQAKYVEYVAEDVYHTEGIYVELNGRRTHSNFARNQRMVDLADEAVAYWVPQCRGTTDCLRRLGTKGIEVVHFGQTPKER